MIHTYIGIAYYKNKVNWTFYMTLNQLKSIFFRSESGHEFKWFPTKKNSLLMVRPDMSANQRPLFWWETTLTHVMTLISEKTDFRKIELNFLAIRGNTITFHTAWCARSVFV